MAQIGDTVRFLNAVGGGKIARIEGRTAYVTDADGFESPVLLSECVVIPGPKAQAGNPDRPQASKDKTPAVEQPQLHPQAETEHGDRLSVALLFEPHDIKHLSLTDFDPILVNDSNYTLLYSVAISERESTEWNTVGSGTIEPNVQIFLDELPHDEINRWERICVQLLALKPDKPYEMKAPVTMMTRMDLTKFAKLHSFTPTAYSNTPVLTVPVITADKPHRQTELTTEMFAPVKEADRPAKKPTPAKRKTDEPEVVDLHIHELLDSTAGMSAGDMLKYQLATFHSKMKEAARRPGAKIIFIHGKGDGVLRSNLLKELRRCYPKSVAQDASFLEYGFGATQITVYV